MTVIDTVTSIDIVGWCNKIIYKKDEFTIALFRDVESGNTYKVKGEMIVAEKRKYRVKAKLAKYNPQYPDTFDLIHIAYDIDLTKASKSDMIKFFETAIDTRTARTIVEEVPNIVEVLESDDLSPLLEIRGVGEKRAEKIRSLYFSQKDLSEAYIYFNDYEFTKKTIDKICKHYMSPQIAVAKAKRNPYSLTEVSLLGFKKVDQAVLLMCKNTNTAIDNKQRFIAYIKYLFEDEYANGNTWLSPRDLIDHVMDFVPGVDALEVINYINDSKDYYIIDNENGQYGYVGKRITSAFNLNLEMGIAEELRRLMTDESRLKDVKNVDQIIKRTEDNQGWEYADEQKQAINAMLKYNVCIIQGTAGSGKSSAVKGYVNVLKDNHYDFCQCALSGKAADNLTQVTGSHGSTIHSLIGKGMEFQYGKAHPLATDVVILDEISMVEDKIFLDLLRAIPQGGKLIMLGDAGQLDSIGAGCLNGMIRSGAIPTITLTQIHRQAKESAIITHSMAFRQGMIPAELKLKAFSEKVYGDKQDLKYIIVKKDEEDEIPRLVMEEYKKLLTKYPVEDTQIICSTKTTGTVSTFKLNAYAQIVANPKSKNKKEITIGRGKDNYVLREGDKVMNFKNNRTTVTPNDEPRPIYNGNTGILKEVSDDCLIIDFDGMGLVKVEGNEAIRQIRLGYACTTHKTEGSTIKAVIFALPFHFLLNSRELVYTGVTRASDYQTIITSSRSLKDALGKTSKRTEKTNLDIFIRELNIWKKELGVTK